MKKKIVIASVLKPVDDVRACWKLSQSLAKTNKYEVNIIGNEGKKPTINENIVFHAHTLNRTNWLKRILIRELILFRILKLRPKLLIITTHELINIALICKLFLGMKLIYDVQENYSRNLIHMGSSLLHKLMGHMIRWKENFSSPFIDQYWLAEKCYLNELSFTYKKYLIVENKAFNYEKIQQEILPIKMLFTGTISDYGGIKRVVKLFKKIQQENELTTLTIVGQVHDSSLEKWLINQAELCQGLKLNISKNSIPYEDIMQSISSSNLGIIGYQPNLINGNKIPTKLYEYSRYQLPFLVEENTKWSKIGSELGGAIPINFSNIDSAKIIESMKNSSYLFPKSYPKQATWEYESNQIVSSLNNLID